MLIRAIRFLTAASLPALAAPLDFSPAFSPGMVIQRDAAITVAGRGSAGGSVKVSFGSQERSARVLDDGSWKLDLAAMEAGGPYSLMASDGKTTAAIEDVLIGDVWVFSGQSNMQMGLGEAIGGSDAIAAASRDTSIRLLAVPKSGADAPQRNIGAKWQGCSPESLRKFSAVAGFFALDLRKPAAPFRTDEFPPHTLAFQPLPTVFRLEGRSYQLETASSGSVASLVAGGKQFLSNEPGGGTRIPAFLGQRNLSSMRAIAPNRIEFGDNTAKLEIACADDSMEWTIRNNGNDAIEFHIALAPRVRVNPSGQTAELSQSETTLKIEGFDRLEAGGKIVSKIRARQSGVIRWTFK